jgi:hypothetical protein
VKRGTATFGPRHLEVLADRAPGVRVVSGGYGSGKTSVGVGWLVDLGLRAGHLGPILATEPTYRSVVDVMEASIMRYCDLWGLPYRRWVSDHIFQIGRAKKFEVWCRSLDKPRAVEGINAIGLWSDEWELCDPEALVPAMQRVRVGDALEILLTGTPEGYGPAWETVLAKPAPTTRQYIIRTQDNPFLPDSYVVDSAARLGTDDAIKEKLEGIRTARGGRVYSRFDRKTNASPVVKSGRLVIGCDFNVRNMQWIIAEVDDVDRKIHVVGEVIKEGGTTTDEHAERAAKAIMGILAKRGRRVSREDVHAMRLRAYPDASGASLHTTSTLSDIHLLLQAGFRPDPPTRNPPVMERVNTVNVLFRDRRLSVDVDACPMLTRALETQALDRNGEPEKKTGALDVSHVLDALGYVCHRLYPVQRRAGVSVVPDAVVDEWGRVA